MTILNLTQHPATPDQIAAGVIDPPDHDGVRLLLTFDTLPSQRELMNRALALREIVRESGATSAMIGGAPYLMPHLDAALIAAGIRPLYAFSLRESVETIQPDGSVRKTQVFKHAGFVGGECA